MSAAARSPWTVAEERRIVARAVAFIRERVHVHGFELAMEVGGHLYRGLFRSDRRLVQSGGEWKTRSMRSISRSEGVGFTEKQLSDCVHAFMAVEVFGMRAGDVPIPDLTPWQWARLDVPLAGDPAALVELARWKEREGLPMDFVAAAAHLVRPYVAAGGKLEDLVVGGRAPDSPYLRMARIVGVMERWIDTHEMKPEARRRAIEGIDRALAVLGE